MRSLFKNIPLANLVLPQESGMTRTERLSTKQISQHVLSAHRRFKKVGKKQMSSFLFGPVHVLQYILCVCWLSLMLLEHLNVPEPWVVNPCATSVYSRSSVNHTVGTCVGECHPGPAAQLSWMGMQGSSSGRLSRGSSPCSASTEIFGTPHTRPAAVHNVQCIVQANSQLVCSRSTRAFLWHLSASITLY